MTKQEEIREGIARIIANEAGFWEITEADTDLAGFYEDSDKILQYLHSQGVVIKVDKKLHYPRTLSEVSRQRDKLVAVEPLINTQKRVKEK